MRLPVHSAADALGRLPDDGTGAILKWPASVTAFESWDATGRQFDLITCADAWHWIDPASGIEKAASVVRPGGTLAVFWSYQLLDDNVAALFQRIYDEHAPQATTHSYEPRQALGRAASERRHSHGVRRCAARALGEARQTHARHRARWRRHDSSR